MSRRTRRRGDGEVERLGLELDFEGNGPLWSIGDDDLRSQDWADVHIEHAGDVRGRVLIRGRTVTLASRGIRDHSRGPRDYTSLLREGWSWGFFPDGRMFLVLRVWQDNGADLSRGFVFDGTELTEATAVEVPPVHSALGDPETFSVRLDGPFGEEVVNGRIVHSCAYTLYRPIGMATGVDYGRPELTVTVEGPATFEWNGRRGSGWMERMVRAGTLRPPDGRA
jgi:hypothetical protein